MVDPSRSTGRRLRPILLGLIAAVPACLVLYAVVALVVLALGPH
jgi:hypothetical protein